MELSGQLHAPAAFPPGKDSLYPWTFTVLKICENLAQICFKISAVCTLQYEVEVALIFQTGN